MSRTSESNGQTRLAYLLGVRSRTTSCVSGRRWARQSAAVSSSERSRGNFEELTLAVGARHRLGDLLVVKWSNDYGDGAVHRNVTIAEIEDGKAVRVTDYWGAPFNTPEWRRKMTESLEMPASGRWPAVDNLTHH
jgi:hypothetical protein